jgi:hypothetical protein
MSSLQSSSDCPLEIQLVLEPECGPSSHARQVLLFSNSWILVSQAASDFFSFSCILALYSGFDLLERDLSSPSFFCCHSSHLFLQTVLLDALLAAIVAGLPAFLVFCWRGPQHPYHLLSEHPSKVVVYGLMTCWLVL